MNNHYDRENTPSHITLDEQLDIDEQLSKIHRQYDQLIEKVYLMGYKKGLLHNQNTPHFP